MIYDSAVVSLPARVAALQRPALLDTPPEPAFDRLTQLTCRLIGAPIALISLVDAERQFFKSCVGLPEPWASRRETPLSHSFCQYVVASGTPFVVIDARDHPLVRDNPAIRDLGVVAYAGVPLTTSEGHVLGALCAISTTPRRWTQDDLAALQDLAALAMTEIELRIQIAERRRVEEALSARVRQQATVSQLGQRALASTELFTLLDDAVALAARTLEVEYAKVLELLPQGDQFLLRAGVGWRTGSVGYTTVSAGAHSQAGYTLLAGEPVIVEDLRAEARFHGPPLLLEHGVISGMSVLIPGAERPFGVLGIHTVRHRRFTHDDIHFLQAVANVLAAAVERSRAEEKLHLYRRIFESSNDGIAIIDPEGVYIEQNAAHQQLLGYTSEELRQRTPAIHLGEEAFAQIGEALARHGQHRGEFTSRTKSGGTLTIELSAFSMRNDSGEVVCHVGIKRDITERKRAEEAQRFLAEAGAILAASVDYETRLAELARLVVPYLADWCIVDMIEEDGSLNQVAVAHVDSAKEQLARDLRRRYPPDPAEPHPIWQVLYSGDPDLAPTISVEELTARAHDPEHLRVLQELGIGSHMVVPLVAHDYTLGAISFVAGASGRHYDSTDLEQARELARRAALAVDNARLYREAQRAIRVRDQFLSIAAHELKTPLTSLLGHAQLLERRGVRDGTLQERDHRAVRVIVEQANRLNRMIATLLDLSRIQAGLLSIERQSTDLCALAQRVIEEIRPMLHQHTLDLTCPTEPLFVEGDELRLEQVLQNLISNAVKYSPAGGPVWISLERRGALACVAVSDRGIGIPQAAQAQLFQRFYRAPNAEQQSISGMGIGLYVVKEIVALHDGIVSVQSEEGHGSVFTICLPLHASRIGGV